MKKRDKNFPEKEAEHFNNKKQTWETAILGVYDPHKTLAPQIFFLPYWTASGPLFSKNV